MNKTEAPERVFIASEAERPYYSDKSDKTEEMTVSEKLREYLMDGNVIPSHVIYFKSIIDEVIQLENTLTKTEQR